MRRRAIGLTTAVLALCLVAGAAWAYWTTTGTGSASATVGTLAAPTNVSASATTGSGTVGVSWTGVSSPAGGAVTGYYVQRFSGATASPACGSSSSSLLPATPTSCSDTGVADGTYTYKVTAVYRSWSARSAASGSVTVVNDTTPPTVSSIVRVTTSPTNTTGTLQWTVTFSESVTGVTASNFSLASSGLGGTPAITSVTGSGPTYTVTASTGSGSGTLGLNQSSTTGVQDGVGNALSGTFTGQVYTLDRTAPTVSSIVRVTSSPSNVSSVQWTVTFSESVTGVGASNFALVSSGLGGTPAITSVTGSGATYTVTASTGSGSGTLGLNLTSVGSIQDLAGNALTGTPFTGQVYTLDRTAPTVSSIVRVTGSPTNASSVQWTVTFSESVTGVGASNFALVSSGLGGTPAITSVTGSGATYTVTASTGSGSGTLGLNQSATTGVQDGAGNALSGTFTGQTYTLDRTAPTVSSIVRVTSSPTNTTGTLQWTVTFSESVTGVSASNFSLASSGLGGTPAITSVTGSGANYTVTASTGSGSGTLGLNQSSTTGVQDGAGNALSGTFTGPVYTLDRTAPTVSSIVRVTSSPTSASSVQWTVTFSEPVTGVATGNFSLVSSGLGGTPAITSVTGSGTTYTVTASTGSGSGTLGLNQSSTTGVQDSVGNALSGTFTGDVYTINRGPRITSIVTANGGTANKIDKGDTITVTYSEALKVSSVCSTWSNDANNQTLATPSDVTVTVTNGGTANDSLTVTSATCTLHLGTFDLGSLAYYTSGTTTPFGGSGSNASKVDYNATAHTITITIGGGSQSAAVASTVLKLTPDLAVTNPAGDPIAGTFSTSNVPQF